MLLRLGWLGTYVQTQHDDFDDVQGRGGIPIIHDQDIAITEARLALDVGLTSRFSASLMLPVRVVSTTIRYLDGMGDVVQLVTPSTHHRNETLSGLADPMVLGAATHAWGGLRVTGRAGLSIPLGRTEENPFVDPDMPHQHIQMGTGTVNPVVAAELAYGWDRWRVAGFVFTQQTVYENSKGYHAGDRYAAGVALRRALGSAWSVRGGLEMQAESYERWDGIRYTDEGNQGRIDAMVATGASWQATDALSIDLGLKIPFINHVVGGQLNVPALVEVGASWSFGGRAPATDDHADEHDHDHDHGAHGHDEHGEGEHGGGEHAADDHVLDTTGADVADLGANGSAVDLVPVPGKVTIFDFWATWCEPCKTLEPVLVELAKKYPDKVALRRIDVVDWDSPVVAQHLTPRGFDLPHVKIADATGAIVFEDSSGPGKLASMIETIKQTVEKGAAPTPTPTPTPAPAPTPAPGSTPAPDPAPTPAPAPMPAPAPTAPPAAAPKAKAKAPIRFDIEVTVRGFEPGNVVVPRGTPVTLRFHRKVEKTCATEVIMQVAGKRIEKKLPIGTLVELTLTFPTAGVVSYACAMNMIKGTITVR